MFRNLALLTDERNTLAQQKATLIQAIELQDKDKQKKEIAFEPYRYDLYLFDQKAQPGMMIVDKNGTRLGPFYPDWQDYLFRRGECLNKREEFSKEMAKIDQDLIKLNKQLNEINNRLSTYDARDTTCCLTFWQKPERPPQDSFDYVPAPLHQNISW